MDERVIKLTVRLTPKEHEHLKREADECGLKMEPYIRKLIAGSEVKARPPNEYVTLIREINAIGNNINQIAHIANAEGRISDNKISEAKKYLSDIMQLVRGLR